MAEIVLTNAELCNAMKVFAGFNADYATIPYEKRSPTVGVKLARICRAVTVAAEAVIREGEALITGLAVGDTIPPESIALFKAKERELGQMPATVTVDRLTAKEADAIFAAVRPECAMWLIPFVDA